MCGAVTAAGDCLQIELQSTAWCCRSPAERPRECGLLNQRSSCTDQCPSTPPYVHTNTRAGATLCATEDGRRLYVFGGHDGVRLLSCVYYLDTERSTWSNVAPTGALALRLPWTSSRARAGRAAGVHQRDRTTHPTAAWCAPVAPLRPMLNPMLPHTCCPILHCCWQALAQNRGMATPPASWGASTWWWQAAAVLPAPLRRAALRPHTHNAAAAPALPAAGPRSIKAAAWVLARVLAALASTSASRPAGARPARGPRRLLLPMLLAVCWGGGSAMCTCWTCSQVRVRGSMMSAGASCLHSTGVHQTALLQSGR